MARKTCLTFLFAILIALLSGCGGGGGGGAETAGAAPSGPSGPANQTDEFNRNYGLGLINAQEAYANGATGKGIVVAVIDSGIDTDHPDLADKISPDSKDLSDPLRALDDTNGHGTMVAGIVAAKKNDVEVHGVAYDATILALGVCSLSACALGHLENSAVLEAIVYAVDHGAHVINMSFGYDAEPAVLAARLASASDAGVIMVAATGNDAAMQPGWPARWASDSALDGLLIAVGAVGSDGNIWKFSDSSGSNQCGDAANFCLVAPGVDVRSTYIGGQYVVGTGTSFAAPHVSGAAALLLELFPNLTPQQIVQRLFTTATDLGVAGVDAIYGHGLLNLQAAVQPVGVLAVPLSGSAANGGAPVTQSWLVLGPAFGDALQSVPALSQAIGVDDFNAAFGIDLSGNVVRVERGFGLEALLSPGDRAFVTSRLPSGASVSLGLDKRAKTGFGLREAHAPDYEVGSMLLSSDLSDASSISFGYGLTALQQFDLGPDARDRSLFWSSSEVLSPQHGLVGKGSGAAFEMALADDTQLSLGWFHETGDAIWDAGNSGIGQVTLDHSFGFGGTMRVGASYLSEQELFLGSQSTGAFGSDSAAQSLFVTMSGTVPLTDQIELIGSVTHGSTRIDQRSAALLNDWSTVSSAAFGAGVVARDVFADQDRLGFLGGQPLRVYDATARATVPTAVRKDNSVVYDVSRVDATPSGREIDFQLAYETSLLPGTRLSNWLMMRFNPGHDRNAATNYAVGAKLSIAF